MPMTAFLLQGIPAQVAEYASREARTTRRALNDVLLEMLGRAAAQAAPSAAAVPLTPSVAAAQPMPTPSSASVPPAATVCDAEPEALPLLEAMQAAQFIPSG